MIKLIIFDFDGTLVDSKSVIYEIIKKTVRNYHYALGKSFKGDMGDWPLKEHLSRIGINKNRKDIIYDIKNDLALKGKGIKLAKNVRALEKIEKEKIILSNSHREFIKWTLKKFNLDFFKEIHSPDEFHSKAEGISHILKKKKIKPNEAIYIGDRESDIRSSRKVGCFCISVSNGISWSPKTDILKAKPDYIITDLKEIKGIVERLDQF